MRRFGPAGALAALVAGILVGEARGPGSATGALLVAVALLIAALRWRGRRGFVIAVVACALLGGAVMQRALHGLQISPLRAAVELRTRVEVEGTLVDDPSGPRFEVQVLLRLGRVNGSSAGSRTVLLVGGGDLTSRLRVLSAGDHVTVDGTIEPLIRLRRPLPVASCDGARPGPRARGLRSTPITARPARELGSGCSPARWDGTSRHGAGAARGLPARRHPGPARRARRPTFVTRASATCSRSVARTSRSSSRSSARCSGGCGSGAGSSVGSRCSCCSAR